ncbi:MAG: 2'-5' RNA ligase family protein [Clostridia bacterium]|jgi:2'-5' RNA ligase
MSSVSLYEKIHQDSMCSISGGDIDIDPCLSDHVVDQRRGVSLIIPVKGIRKDYEALVARFRNLAPEQYYYPFEDLHVTVFDFVQAFESYTRSEQQEDEFRQISHEALEGIGQFPLRLRGPVFSSAAGLLAGYDDDILVTIRKTIRRLMVMKGLRNDERYESHSAHVTFCRFRSPLADPAGFVRLIDACRDLQLGTEEVAFMELVEHDWYNSTPTKRVIATIALGRGD